MKLLFDQNLSPKLPERLANIFPDSIHVRSFNYQRAPDAFVWDLARNKGYVVVTKDGDFSDRSTLYGFPPKIVWFKRGNCATADVEAIIRQRAVEIKRFADDSDTGVLVIE